MRRAAPLLLLWAAACRQQLLVDTSEAEFIPRDVAIDGLKELLATADGAECTEPKTWLRGDEIRDWAVDDAGVEARAEGKPAVRVEFKDVSATRLDKVALHYQLRIFTPAQPRLNKHYVRFNWTSEADARRALELFDALWRKPRGDAETSR